MPLTAAERQRRRRRKLHNSPMKLQEYQKKDRIRHREKNELLSQYALLDKRRRNKEAQKKCRTKKCQAQPTTEESIYKSKQALGKAKRKVLLALPKSPRKRKLIIEVANTYGITAESFCSTPKRPQHHMKISKEVEEMVQSFYVRDEISRIAPGKRNYIIKRNNDGKIYIQKSIYIAASKKHINYTNKNFLIIKLENQCLQCYA